MYPATSATVIVSSPTRATTRLSSLSPPHAVRTTSAAMATARRKMAGLVATDAPSGLGMGRDFRMVDLPGVMVEWVPTGCKRPLAQESPAERILPADRGPGSAA